MLTRDEEADEQEKVADDKGLQQAILGTAAGIAEDYVKGVTEMSRQVYVEACIREVGIDIKETDKDELELVMEALYKRYEMAVDTDSKVSEDWMCCAAGAEYEYNKLYGQLDEFWAYWDGLGMGFWEDINEMANVQGISWECAAGNWAEKAYERVGEFFGDARDWVEDLF